MIALRYSGAGRLAIEATGMATVECERIPRADDTDGPAQILMVDDQPSNLLALEGILEDLGQHLVTGPRIVLFKRSRLRQANY